MMLAVYLSIVFKYTDMPAILDDSVV